VARFSEQFIQQVAQATDITEVVGRYVALKKRGKELVGLCPFHDDKHPSLNVSPTRQIFKCFACGAGGTVYQFLMRHDKLTFPEAVRTLAESANIRLPRQVETTTTPPGLSKTDLLKVCAFAAGFFRAKLGESVGSAALDYARGRGLTDESMERFSLGYAPKSWDALLHAARGKGFSEAQLLAAGLVARAESSGGLYDRFRNRLIFPILDASGQVIAFGGRALDPEQRAKYLNSPETPLFDKSGQLYGVSWARAGFDSSDTAVVVEGYLDVLIPRQAGLDNFVATLGTALTDRHVRLLARYVREVVLVFDADAAGTAAAERAMEIFLAQQVQVRVATIPGGKDPCDFCLAEGPDALRSLVAEAPDAIQYAWQRRLADYKAAGGNLADQRQAVEDFLRLVASSQAYGAIDEVRRGHLAQHIGHMLNIAPEDLQRQMRRLSRRVGRSPAPAAGEPADEPAGHAALAERHLLETLLSRPGLFDQAAERIAPQDFATPPLRTIAERVWTLGKAGRLSLDNLLATEEMAPLAELIADLAFAGEHRGRYEQTLNGTVEQLAYRRRSREIQQLKASGYSDETLRQLNQRLRDSDKRHFPKIT